MNRAIPFLQVFNISKEYNSKFERSNIVLSNISFSAAQGETILLLGVSGSGKSTLLNIISGIESPSNGSINIKTTNIWEISEKERTIWRKKGLGVVFQFFELHEGLSTRETIELALLINDYPKENFEDRVDYLIDKVNLRKKEFLSVDVLSRGEKQRVAIARALSGNPSLIIADEPTGALDKASAEDVIGLLRQLTVAENKTLLISTHDLNLINDGDHLIVLENGEIIEEIRKVTRNEYLKNKGFVEF